MVKVINNKNINKYTYLNLKSLEQNEFYIAYIENNFKKPFHILKQKLKIKKSKLTISISIQILKLRNRKNSI